MTICFRKVLRSISMQCTIATIPNKMCSCILSEGLNVFFLEENVGILT